jgi:hypothetical protein
MVFTFNPTLSWSLFLLQAAKSLNIFQLKKNNNKVVQ